MGLLDGNTRWESSRMMLPEHKEAIQHFYADQDKVEKHGPLDEQEWERLGAIIMDAMQNWKKVRVVYWQDGHYYNLDGYIFGWDKQEQRLRVQRGDEREWVYLDIIKDVKRL